MARENKSLLIYPDNYVVLDIETTGLSPFQNEIIELSALRIVDGKIQDECSMLVKPLGTLNYFITNLTGITQQMLSNAPGIKEALEEFTEFVSNSIIIGHNINFDIKFIDTKRQESHNLPFDNDFIDTLTLARKHLPQLKSKKLEFIAKHFNLETKGMHRGLKDCKVTNHCYREFAAMACQQKSLINS